MKNVDADATDNMKPCVLYRHPEDQIARVRIVFGIVLDNFVRFAAAVEEYADGSFCSTMRATIGGDIRLSCVRPIRRHISCASLS